MKHWMSKSTRGTGTSPRQALAACPKLEDADDPTTGCGWFDSSWELRRGLAVIEGPALDPLGLWSVEPVGGRRQAQRVSVA